MMVGEDISALANSATLNDRDYTYMIWGVDDTTHEIVGTKVRRQLEKKGEQELENWLRYLLSKNANFEFIETDIEGKHVELIRIHKALNEPVAFQKIDYIRSGSYTKKLHEFPVFRAQLWSLRERFGIPETSSISSSRLIKEAINKKLIKLLDPNTAPRYMKYIPIWA